MLSILSLFNTPTSSKLKICLCSIRFVGWRNSFSCRGWWRISVGCLLRRSSGGVRAPIKKGIRRLTKVRANAGKPSKVRGFRGFWGPGQGPGVYRAVDAVMPRLSGSIHTSSESSQSDERESVREGWDWLWATFGPLCSRIETAHISLDGAYTPYADGLLQEIN